MKAIVNIITVLSFACMATMPLRAQANEEIHVELSPMATRALWIGDSDLFENLSRRGYHQLVNKSLYYETTGKFDQLAHFLGTCNFQGQQHLLKSIVCKAIFAGALRSQGDFPGAAEQELSSHASLTALNAVTKNNFSMPQLNAIHGPESIAVAPKPSAHFDKAAQPFVPWSTSCQKTGDQILLAINGHEGCFTVDLGAPNSTIGSRLASRAGLTIYSSQIKVNSYLAKIGRVDLLRVGPLEVHNAYFAVIPETERLASPNVLGLDLLRQLKDITFMSRGIAINSGMDRHGSCTNPLRYSGSLAFVPRGIVVPAEVNGAHVYLLLDTGLNTNLLLSDPGILANLAPQGSAFGKQTFSNHSFSGWVYSVPINVFGIESSEILTILSPRAGGAYGLHGPVVGLLGLPYLQKHNLQIDFENHCVTILANRA